MEKSLLSLLIIAILFACDKQNDTIKKLPSNLERKINLEKTEVLTLGTFHFEFPNFDIAKIEENNQIDVLESKYQKEIEFIVDKLAKFNPTQIVIERLPEKQELYDSLYKSYLKEQHKLNRSEEQQIGFRLAKKLGLNKLFCADAWGTEYEEVKMIIEGNDTIAKDKFWEYFYRNPDSTQYSFKNENTLFKTKGILAELKRLNSKEQIKKSLGDYLIGVFKYETKDHLQLGPDYVTSWWFNRNLRIYRNIQRIETNAEDRLLVIYGAGHMNLLNIFFESSPEYKLSDINDYLE